MQKPTNKNIALFEKAKAKRVKKYGQCSLYDIQRATGITPSQTSGLLSGRIRFTEAICIRLANANLAPLKTLMVNQAEHDAEIADPLKYSDVEPDFFK